MPAVESKMMALGQIAPDFTLPDTVTLMDIPLKSVFEESKGVLVMFICAHCPYVIHVQEELAQLGKDYLEEGLGIVAISSNDADNYPEDSPQNLADFAIQQGFSFPLCYDETQAVAKAYDAACTPDFFLFDTNQKLVYRGQLDDSRPNSQTPVTGQDLRSAIDNLLAGTPINPEQKPSLGCSIKWK